MQSEGYYNLAAMISVVYYNLAAMISMKVKELLN